MWKNLLGISLFLFALNGQAAPLPVASPTPQEVDRALAYLLAQEVRFEAINHIVVLDPAGRPAMTGPAPGNLFIARGYAVLESPLPGKEFTLTYELAGSFTGFDPASGRLLLNHGLQLAGVSNEIVLYVDDALDADTEDAATYTNGVRVAAAEVCMTAECQAYDGGYLSPSAGEDHVAFRLSDQDRQHFGLDQDVFLQLSSILDFGGYSFAAFDGNCIPQFDNCVRETGSIRSYARPLRPDNLVPVPPVVTLLGLGLGLLAWAVKRRA